MNSEARSRCKGRLIESEEKREAGVVEVHLSLESLERRVEERLNQKVNFLPERLDNAVQVHNQSRTNNFVVLQGMEQNQGSQEMGMKNFREEMAEVLDR